MDTSALRNKLKSFNSWLSGTRIVHLDDDYTTTQVYSKTALPLLEENILETGENVKYDVVNNPDDFREECIKNSLKAVVVDVRIAGARGIDIVYDLFREGIVSCPIFILSGLCRSKFSDSEKSKISEMNADVFDKRCGKLSEIKEHIKSFISGEEAA